MNLSLSDLTPPLRWTPPGQIAPIVEEPQLPEAWWQAIPLDRACAIVGTQTVAGRLADLAVACWGHLTLGDILPLLRFSDPAEAERTPETLGKDVVQKLFSGVFERLLEPAPEAVPAPSRTDKPLPDLIDELFAALDDRQRAIARDRLYAEQRATLDELAQRFSVTRERIRQIERDLREHIDAWLAKPEAGGLVAHVTWLRGRLGVAVPAEDLQTVVPWHAGDLRALGIPAWRFVRTLMTGYEQSDGWLVAGGADDLREKTRQLFSDGPRPLPEAVSMVSQLGVHEDVAERWILAVPQLRVLGQHVVPWPRSVNEKAEAVLAVAGTPLSPEEIQERIGEDYSLVGIRNQLTADERFRRLDRNKYGLTRWGGDEYLGIREMIAREIERAGGEASVSTVVANLTSRYDVSESSVRAYSGGPGFERTQRGWIRVAGTSPSGEAEPYQPRKDVSETRRSFRSRDGRWWHRVDINAEHLRGSGSPLPTGFAAYLGMAPGGQLTASAPSGDVVISWHNQPTMGSIRNVLAEYKANEGDHVFLTVSDGGELLTRYLPAAPLAMPPVNRALYLLGYTAPVSSELEGLRLIGARIGLSDAAGREEVIARLRERGDRDILGFLGS
ncbi:sigma-70-like protein [Nonomuraea fuscirosea]|uniref:Sigma-70-like protein n=1 Tax=Nonomuraea fuscirosea TaxID=1291556 RepID=A0A2T0N131_9ACTN|nr:sigma factor-like helix-turn-helix DNA-binding protein [Nonomuraea fuscirosea]PRX65528.1 sigma-70-like protein [Nonomuraea fuscirosea]